MADYVWMGILIMMVSACQSVPHPTGTGDWADVTLYATGRGDFGDGSFSERMRALQQAKEALAAQLERQALAIRTDSGKTILEQTQKGDDRERVSAYVRRAEIISMESHAQTVTLRARLFLGDSFKGILGLLPFKERTPSSVGSSPQAAYP